MNQSQVSVPHVSRQTFGHGQIVDAIDLRLDEACSDERCTLEARIAEQFASRYDARLSHFLPLLMSLSRNNELRTVVGLRGAGSGQLYLERYLDKAVEQMVSQVAMAPIARDGIIEIGNLVSTKSGSSYLLFCVLAVTLHRAGFGWVVFTATRQIQAMLDQMGFASQTLCAASERKLGDDDARWGSYYETHPHVVTGSLYAAATLMLSNPAIAQLIDGLDTQINQIAAQLVASAQ